MGARRLSLILPQVALILTFNRWVSGYHHAITPANQFEIVHEWTFIDFDFHHERDREEAIRKGDYVPKNVTAFEFIRYKDISFITTPRIEYGVPSTLNTLSHKKAHDGSPLLRPFPDWESNRFGNCHGLTSVFTTHIDDEGRLWVLDSGIVDTYAKVPNRICPTKIVVFDLNAANKVVATYVFPDKVIDCNSFFVRLTVDQRGPHLDDFWVYISDGFAERLVVLDVRHKTFTRVTHKTFLKDPHHVDLYIHGVRAYFPVGLFSITLGPLCDGDRKVYYHALASVEECYVMASTLQNPVFTTNERALQDSFYCFKQTRESPSPLESIYNDVIFYFVDSESAVKCWNTTLAPHMENTAFVSRNETTMQTLESLKLVGNELYGISSKLELLFINEEPANEINYRLLKANVDYLLNGTPCREYTGNEHKSDNKPQYESRR